jgi:hypothetical protein
MTEMPNHSACADVLRDVLASKGVEITVSTEPPIVHNPYVTDPIRCPHRVLFWIEPTSEQIARWAKDAADKEAR